MVIQKLLHAHIEERGNGIDFISFQFYRALPATTRSAPFADKCVFRSGQGSNRLL